MSAVTVFRTIIIAALLLACAVVAVPSAPGAAVVAVVAVLAVALFGLYLHDSRADNAHAKHVAALAEAQQRIEALAGEVKALTEKVQRHEIMIPRK